MASLFSEFIHHLSHPFLRTTACEQCILCPDTYMACLLSQSSLLGIRGREKERREREGEGGRVQPLKNSGIQDAEECVKRLSFVLIRKGGLRPHIYICLN
jgi:hypothetical protein